MSTALPPRFVPTPHPVLGLPSLRDAEVMGASAWAAAMERRERIIAEERSDPFLNGWEPPIWKVCDALLGLDRAGEPDWPEWSERMRQHLGFAEPVDTLLSMGGNRASKSQRASKRAMALLRREAGKRVWAFHSTLDMSVEYQQPLFRLYMPEELKGKDIKSAHTYIAYKEKTGFTDQRFILPNGGRCTFKSYDQEDALEGGEVDWIWCDELVPRDWVETLEFRVATRAGKLEVTFTPVEGYSDTVALFLDGATVVRDCAAFLCPKDGGDPDVPRALGLSAEEYAEIVAAQKQKRPATCPQSRPEQCELWLNEAPMEEGVTLDRLQPREVNGRLFDVVPRVMKCANPKRAIVFFHTNDNPYGNPKEIWSKLTKASADFVRERFYGIAKKQHAAVFRTFNDKVHVIDPKLIPPDGTNYQLTDPHGVGRNYFMMWIRSTPEHDYVYREWPGNYWIPEIGVPGAWALPGTKAKPDGVKGPGQSGFGFSHWQYKKEIARLEGWKEFAEWEARGLAGSREKDIVASWDQWGARKEMIFERFMDSRFAGVPKEVNDQPVTLLTEFDQIGLTYKPTPGDSVSEGVRDIENALYYNPNTPIDFFNKPRLLISSECVNTIFALRIWTGLEKDRGATTEPIGLLRYFYRAGCSYVGGSQFEEEEEDDNYWRT